MVEEVEGTDLAPREEAGLATTDVQAVEGMFGDEDMQPTEVILPEIDLSKEDYFVVPGGGFVKELVGTVIHMHQRRVYFKVPYEEQQTADDKQPDCTSIDALTPDGYILKPSGLVVEPPNDACAGCPMNVWGSGPRDRGKACAEQIRIVFLREGHQQPEIINVRSTSAGVKGDLRKFWQTANSPDAKPRGYIWYKVRMTLTPEKKEGGSTSILHVNTIDQHSLEDPYTSYIVDLFKGAKADHAAEVIAARDR